MELKDQKLQISCNAFIFVYFAILVHKKNVNSYYDSISTTLNTYIHTHTHTHTYTHTHTHIVILYYRQLQLFIYFYVDRLLNHFNRVNGDTLLNRTV